ncbi:Transcriptional regulator, LysR family [Sulfitobacter noctilucicola]|uniref:DNA-binding transcriptional LysR family regulator n=1 Tax=Sulfitobacter noctilucicola TaxID=1342301 RepID=A0A7W6M6H0_9RHOB|nr:LysR family transcriptional regulator [Sulfitobacter noctilucicola]KIN62168.1 Transcriptional regulator, LysR family [Sulfitobacter noctilucicola]MBB4173314.1 DNA-binding transcriptional LysR family regulator [Sulfitobacter noctilucicola]
MDIQSLRLFVLASETLNISAAGRTLGMAPAVASTRIAKLENLVGADLLHRSTRKVSLSLEGQDFLPYAREMIAQEEAALAALGKGRTKIGGTLRFAAPSTFAQLYIAPLLPEFMDKYPDLRLDLHLSDSQFDLIEGSYDLALRNSVLADSSLTARKLADDTRILCASPAYLERYGTPDHPDDLAQHRLIAFNDVEPRTLVSYAGDQALYDPKRAAHCLVLNDGLTQKLTTLQGAGISINSLWAVRKELVDGTLARVLPDYEMASKPAIWLIYPKSNVVSAKVRVFMDFLIDHLGRATVSGKAP